MKTADLAMPRWKAKDQARVWSRGTTPQDKSIARAFRAIGRGHRVIDLYESMRIGGCDRTGRPRLAIARADATRVRIDRWARDPELVFQSNAGYKTDVSIPTSVLPELLDRVSGTAKVPIIPPPYRRYALGRYFVLFEAEWESVTKDPLLLWPCGGSLYIVVAAWDLTPVEQAVLRGRR